MILRVLKVDEIAFLPGGVLRNGGKRREQPQSDCGLGRAGNRRRFISWMVVSELYLGKAKLNTAPEPETAIYCLPSNE